MKRCMGIGERLEVESRGLQYRDWYSLQRDGYYQYL